MKSHGTRTKHPKSRERFAWHSQTRSGVVARLSACTVERSRVTAYPRNVEHTPPAADELFETRRA